MKSGRPVHSVVTADKGHEVPAVTMETTDFFVFVLVDCLLAMYPTVFILP